MTPSSIIGRRAPEFEVPCTTTPTHPEPIAHLRDYQDRWLILMFYPQDFSLVCPTELSAMSNHYGEYIEHGADILALSTDTVQSHEQWIAKPKSEGGLGPIQYPLGSDLSGDVSRAYGVFLDSRRIALRGLFIIDPNAVVQMQVIHNLSVGRRSEDILRVLHALQVGGLCAENWTPGDNLIDAATELQPGSIISHYRIDEKIGDGGFAVVFRGYDRTLERPVALKILKPTGKHVPSIQQEARSAAALNHPNVCTIYNIDDSEGTPMIVMEYLKGLTLKQMIMAGDLEPKKVASIAAQVALGMSAAHDAGVIHGDLKPANIIVTHEGTAKVLDFGLANRRKLRDLSASTISLNLAGSGSLTGTPSYMSPEQADGAGASAAGDVFSFGVVIHELLTGRQVFGGTDILKVLSQIRCIDPGELLKQISEPFRPTLGRMLIRDPRQRTITMREVGQALNNMP